MSGQDMYNAWENQKSEKLIRKA